MSALHREFVLNGPEAWKLCVAFVKGNAKAMNDRESPLRVIVTTAEAKRRDEQNSAYWKYVVTPIAEQAWVNGRQFSKDVWHEHYAEKFAAKVEFVLPSGEIRSRRKSTTEMGVKEFAEYVQRVRADAATELAVIFEED
jgi:hypothetical protein